MRSPPEGVSDNRDRNFLIMDKNPRLNLGTHLAQSARYGGEGAEVVTLRPFLLPLFTKYVAGEFSEVRQEKVTKSPQ
jgi:hypothetical protein